MLVRDPGLVEAPRGDGNGARGDEITNARLLDRRAQVPR
jgi:hypothetical protein